MSSRYVTAPSPQDIDRQEAKSLGKLNTDEVCQWFTGIGLAKCLPFIRGTHLSLTQLAASSPTTTRPTLEQKNIGACLEDFSASAYSL